MANALFNVSPIKFLSTIQDHIYTVTPTFKNISYGHNKQSSSISTRHEQEQPSPVTLQLTPAEQQESSAAPIDIPSNSNKLPYINIPNGSNDINNSYGYSKKLDYGVLAMPNDLLSTSYNSTNSYNNLISLANSVPNIAHSPYLPAEDLTVHFDGLAVQSPTNSHYSGSVLYSPQQINSPNNLGSPSNYAYPVNDNPHSPLNSTLLGTSPMDNYMTSNAHNVTGGFFVGSPNNDTSTFEDLSTSFGFSAYFSPTLNTASFNQQQLSPPINSPSPTNSTSVYLFPPVANYSRSTSPVPDDVVLTSSEVSDYMNTPYLSASVSSNSASPIVTQNQQPLGVSHSTAASQNMLFGSSPYQQSYSVPPVDIAADLSLIPAVVSPSPHNTQPQSVNNLVQPNSPISDLMFEEYEEKIQETTADKKDNRKILITKTLPSGRKAKVHTCPYCSHTSNRANNMREHTQIHNPNRPKPHVCSLCDRTFARKHDMNRHNISCKKQHGKNGGNNSKYLVSPYALSPPTPNHYKLL